MYGFTCIIIGAELRVVKKMFKLKTKNKKTLVIFYFYFKVLHKYRVATSHQTSHQSRNPCGH